MTIDMMIGENHFTFEGPECAIPHVREFFYQWLGTFDSNDQAKIDSLTARAKATNDALEQAVTDTTPATPA